MRAPGHPKKMRRRPGLGELGKNGRGWRFPRLQFRGEVPEMVNLMIEILEYDASRAVGWMRSDWAMAVAVSEHGMANVIISIRSEMAHHENNLGSQ